MAVRLDRVRAREVPFGRQNDLEGTAERDCELRGEAEVKRSTFPSLLAPERNSRHCPPIPRPHLESVLVGMRPEETARIGDDHHVARDGNSRARPSLSGLVPKLPDDGRVDPPGPEKSRHVSLVDGHETDSWDGTEKVKDDIVVLGDDADPRSIRKLGG